MSVMSLHGAVVAGGSQIGNSSGDPYPSANRMSHPAGVSGGQQRTGRGSSMGSSPHKPTVESQHAQAIQKITITEKMHQGKARGEHGGPGGTTAEWSPAQRLKYSQNEPVGQAGPSPSTIQKRSVAQETPTKAPLGKMATVDQRLQHYARHSIHNQSESTSRYVTFQGEQIDNLKMSLGADSAKNVTFYGKQHNAQLLQSGGVPSAAHASPAAAARLQGPPPALAGSEPQVVTNPRSSKDLQQMQALTAESPSYRNEAARDVTVVPHSPEFEEITRLVEGSAPPEGYGGMTGRSGS